MDTAATARKITKIWRGGRHQELIAISAQRNALPSSGRADCVKVVSRGEGLTEPMRLDVMRKGRGERDHPTFGKSPHRYHPSLADLTLSELRMASHREGCPPKHSRDECRVG